MGGVVSSRRYAGEAADAGAITGSVTKNDGIAGDEIVELRA